MKLSRHSDELRQKLGLVMAAASAASRALWNHPNLVELLPEYLFTVHCSARATVTLMETVRKRACELAAADGVAEGVARYLARHIPEELHHDEWFLEDLEALGVPRARTLARVPAPSVAAMVGSQYYWALHFHPVALLGFLAVLEGYPASAVELGAVIARTGLPRRAFRTLLEHSDLDRGHRDDLYGALDALPLTPHQSALIAVSAFTTLHLTTCALEEIVQGASQLDAGEGVSSRRARASRTRATSLARPGSGPSRKMR